MATFSELCKNVMIKTNRPELVDQTQLAVKHAIQFLHLQDFWMRDMLEDLKQWTPATSLIRLSVRSTFQRWRKFNYIKKFDLDSLVTKEGENHQITEIAPSQIFDQYGRLKTNKFYVAGDSLNLRLSGDERAILVGWWTYPDVSQENIQSWIAEMVPAAIEIHAASKIFRDVGMLDEANNMMKEVMELWVPTIMKNDIEATGR